MQIIDDNNKKFELLRKSLGQIKCNKEDSQDCNTFNGSPAPLP